MPPAQRRAMCCQSHKYGIARSRSIEAWTRASSQCELPEEIFAPVTCVIGRSLASVPSFLIVPVWVVRQSPTSPVALRSSMELADDYCECDQGRNYFRGS